MKRFSVDSGNEPADLLRAVGDGTTAHSRAGAAGLGDHIMNEPLAVEGFRGMGAVGFEPTKAEPSDLQSDPFVHFGTRPSCLPGRI